MRPWLHLLDLCWKQGLDVLFQTIKIAKVLPHLKELKRKSWFYWMMVAVVEIIALKIHHNWHHQFGNHKLPTNNGFQLQVF